MIDIRYMSLGEVWLALLERVFDEGITVGDETRELLNVAVSFAQGVVDDPLLVRFASADAITEMRKVFFSTGPNRFGHSYAEKLRGPAGRNDLSDVVALLASEPESKRAVVTLVGSGDGKVPCINAIHFLRRSDGLRVHYFARGQDVFRKFYADAVCIADMADRVADRLGTRVVEVCGQISSAHVYAADLPAIVEVLAAARPLMRPGRLEVVT